MQLTTQTDYALRTLLMLALKAPDKCTVAEISQAYGISEHHLVKVVGRLTQHGYVRTTRGKDGGVRLAIAPAEISIGQVVRELEPELGVVSCLRDNDRPCTIYPACKLRRLFVEATEQFIATLSAYRLSDVLDQPAELSRLLQIRNRDQADTQL